MPIQRGFIMAKGYMGHPIEGPYRGWGCIAASLNMRGLREGSACMGYGIHSGGCWRRPARQQTEWAVRRVTRVSLSDWLALQARIRGSNDPRLLRDRPTDGAASAC